MLIPRLRNALLLSTTSSAIASNSISTQFFASFHKANNKYSFSVKERQDKTLTKSQVRIAIRQRRADTKKALEDFLHKSGSAKHSFLEEESGWSRKVGLEDESDKLHEKRRAKCSARHAKKSHQKKNKRKPRKDSFYESFDDHPERTFHSRYESFFRNAESEWRERLNWQQHRNKTWGSSSDFESDSDDESCPVVSRDNRTLLGLPQSGCLKLEDVKKAFHVSALKWHPDKHQGPSQAMAEEKFKMCVDAYKSLCKSISTSTTQ